MSLSVTEGEREGAGGRHNQILRFFFSLRNDRIQRLSRIKGDAGSEGPAVPWGR